MVVLGRCRGRVGCFSAFVHPHVLPHACVCFGPQEVLIKSSRERPVSRFVKVLGMCRIEVNQMLSCLADGPRSLWNI